MKCHDIKK